MKLTVSNEVQSMGLSMRMTSPMMERYYYKSDSTEVAFELYKGGFNVYAYTADGELETTIVAQEARHNTGSDAVNERLSLQRADAVSTYLSSCGIAKERMTSEGKSYSMPVADNATAEGRAQNRRVEVYISANADMVKAAEEGKLK